MSRTRDEMRLYQRARRTWPQSGNLANRPEGCPADRSEARSRARPYLRKDRHRGLPSDAGRSPARDADRGRAPRDWARVPRNHVAGLDARDRRPARPRPCPLRSRIPSPARYFRCLPYGKWQAKVETMVAALAARNDAQERRIAELERKAALDEKMSGQLAKAAAGLIEEFFGIQRPRRRA